MSSNRDSIIEESNNPLLNLPPELLVAILRFLNLKELKTITLVSKHFFNIYSDFFHFSLHTQAMLFDIWNYPYITKLKLSGEELVSQHHVTFINQPQDDPMESAIHYALFGFAFVTLLLAVFFIHEATKPTYAVAEENRFSAFVLAIMSTVSFILSYTYLQTTDEQYQDSLITQKHLDELDEFIKDNVIFKDLLLTLLNKDQFKVGSLSVSQFLSFIQIAIKEIETLSQAYITHLRTTCSPYKTQLNQEDINTLADIDTQLVSYNNIFHFWARHNLRLTTPEPEKPTHTPPFNPRPT